MNPNPVVDTSNTVASPVEDKKSKFKFKKKPNILVIVLVLAILAFCVSRFMANVHIVNNRANGTEQEEERITVSTGQTWGDKYAYYVQKIFSSVDQFDITYIDFNEDGVPEAVVKYSTDVEKDAIWVLMLTNNEVSETKVFHNASFKLLYSFREDIVQWYLYIQSDSKYGAYTLMNKIMNGTALDSDVKTTNDKEITAFNANYVVSSYSQSFYEIKKASFEEDIKTSVGKYSDYAKDVASAKNKLLDDHKANLPSTPSETDELLTVGEFTLHYGDYYTMVPRYELGEEVGQDEKIVTIHSDGTITDGENKIAFQVFGNTFSLENGISFKVTGNDTFVYGSGEGLEYQYK